LKDSVLAAVFRAPGQPLELCQMERPLPHAGEAVVDIDCCTICGSDLHTISGTRQEPTPTILGHEILGTVVDVAETPLCDLTGQPLQPGDRITWSVCVACHRCDRCLGGMPQKCRQVFKYGHAVASGRQALSGGLAKTILLRPGSAVVRLPSDLPNHLVCPANCATATIAAAFRVAPPIEGKRVLIFGAGMLGLTAAAFARNERAATVVVCDTDHDRLQLATRFDVDDALLWSAMRAETGNQEMKFDLILEASGSADAVEAAFDCCEIGGAIVLVGSVMASRAVQIDPQQLVRRWISVHGVHNYAPVDLQSAIEFLTQTKDRFPFTDLVQESFPLEKVNEAVQYAIDKRPIRVAIEPSS
jgi:putative phosphonate catabolism associated alcohol dehydrogenase